MLKVFQKFFLILCLILFFQLTNAQISYEAFKVVLIHQFAEKTEWKNENDIEVFKIGFLGDDIVTYNAIDQSLESSKIKGKQTELVQVGNLADDLSEIQLLYVSENPTISYKNIWLAIEKKNIFLITDKCDAPKYIMVNITYDEDNQKGSFEINKANIIIEELSIDPELLLLGGKEIDVRELYHDMKQALEDEKKEVEKHKETIEQHKAKINQQTNALNNLQEDIDALTEKKIASEENLKYFSDSIQTQQDILAQKSRQIASLGAYLRKYELNVSSKEKEIDEKGKKILSQTSKLDSLINKSFEKEREIEIKNLILIQKDKKLKSRNRYLIIFALFLLVLIITTFFLYRIYRINRKLSSKLEEKVSKRTKELSLAKEEAEESEEKLKLIANNLVDGMIYQVTTLYENKRKFNYISDAVYNLYGCTAEEAMEDSNLIYGRIHKDDIQSLVSKEKEALKNMSTFKAEVRVMNPDNSIRWSYYISKPRIIDGSVCWDGIEIDITDRKKTEHELILAKEKAEESDHFKSAFLANMSHEIRTPMNGIIGFSELLSERDLSESKRNMFINTINNSCQQLLGIVNDIIDISKIETGQIDINQEETNINLLFDELFSTYSQAVTKDDLEIKMQKSLSDSQSIILTDKIKLRQILENLISNAIKFTDKGQVKFGYKLINNNLEFCIKDTGIGISKKEEEIIFGRFNQAKLDTAQKYGGTGLGLSIAKAYVEKLGGKMWLKSKEAIPDEGKTGGSTFFFTLPYMPVTFVEKKEIMETRQDEINSQLCILVVEDDETNFLFIEEILSELNADVLHAITGTETIEIYKNNPQINLVLMDIKLPDISGLEITKKLRIIRDNIPIIAQTAYALEGDREKALNAGCVDYISKPIVSEELIRMVKQYA